MFVFLLKVKYSYYHNIFKHQFSLTFGRPQVDTCCTCEEIKIKLLSPTVNDAAKKIATIEKAIHLRRAKKFSTEMQVLTEIMKHDDTVGAIAIDYMQNLSRKCFIFASLLSMSSASIILKMGMPESTFIMKVLELRVLMKCAHL